jgi:hypothetical protein
VISISQLFPDQIRSYSLGTRVGRTSVSYVIQLIHSERGCHPATVRGGGRRAWVFNHRLRINAEAVLMLSTLL